MQIFDEPKFWASTSNEKNSSVLLTGFNFLVQYRIGDKEKFDGHRTGRYLTDNECSSGVGKAERATQGR